MHEFECVLVKLKKIPFWNWGGKSTVSAQYLCLTSVQLCTKLPLIKDWDQTLGCRSLCYQRGTIKKEKENWIRPAITHRPRRPWPSVHLILALVPLQSSPLTLRSFNGSALCKIKMASPFKDEIPGLLNNHQQYNAGRIYGRNIWLSSRRMLVKGSGHYW